MVSLNLHTPFDGDHRAHIPSYTIFVNALGRSHHPPVRFEGFEIINISLDVMSRADSLRLPSLYRN